MPVAQQHQLLREVAPRTVFILAAYPCVLHEGLLVLQPRGPAVAQEVAQDHRRAEQPEEQQPGHPQEQRDGQRHDERQAPRPGARRPDPTTRRRGRRGELAGRDSTRRARPRDHLADPAAAHLTRRSRGARHEHDTGSADEQPVTHRPRAGRLPRVALPGQAVRRREILDAHAVAVLAHAQMASRQPRVGDGQVAARVPAYGDPSPRRQGRGATRVRSGGHDQPGQPCRLLRRRPAVVEVAAVLQGQGAPLLGFSCEGRAVDMPAQVADGRAVGSGDREMLHPVPACPRDDDSHTPILRRSISGPPELSTGGDRGRRRCRSATYSRGQRARPLAKDGCRCQDRPEHRVRVCREAQLAGE